MNFQKTNMNLLLLSEIKMNPEFLIIYRQNLDTAINAMKACNQRLVTAYNSTPESNPIKRLKISSSSSLLVEHIKTIEWVKNKLHLESATSTYRQLVENKHYEKIIKGAESVLE